MEQESILTVRTIAATSTPISTTCPSQLLDARAQCPANTFPCPTSLGAVFHDICCQSGQLCALDANNSPACCPSGAVCTGMAPGGVGANPTAAPSYVPNSYFSFPYAPTTFPNSASCASAAKACSKNYDACLANFKGTAYGVTVNVPGGGGTTVNGDTRTNAASATAICSSLSSQACSNIEATKCDSFGQGSLAPAIIPNHLLLLVLVTAIATLLQHLVTELPH